MKNRHLISEAAGNAELAAKLLREAEYMGYSQELKMKIEHARSRVLDAYDMLVILENGG